MIMKKEKLVDYVAMDFKAPLEKYNEAVNAEVNIEALKKSKEALTQLQIIRV